MGGQGPHAPALVAPRPGRDPLRRPLAQQPVELAKVVVEHPVPREDCDVIRRRQWDGDVEVDASPGTDRQGPPADQLAHQGSRIVIAADQELDVARPESPDVRDVALDDGLSLEGARVPLHAEELLPAYVERLQARRLPE